MHDVVHGINGNSCNTEAFIQKSIALHGEGILDYSKVDYIHSKLHVDIGCLVCGAWFKQKPNHNLTGRGCPSCGKKRQGQYRKHSAESFLARCAAAHGDRYDYSLSKYTTTNQKVTIICEKHGEFTQTPAEHFRGAGCPLCFGDTRGKAKQSRAASDFIAESVAIHGDKYDYSKVKYTLSTEYVVIGCRTCGVDFKQTPSGHKSGFGCAICASNQRGFNLRNSTEDFIKSSKAKHGDGKFLYDRVEYTKALGRVDIGCASCGNYWSVKASKHLAGHGCSYCAEYGFNFEKPAMLYVLSCGSITKVGITNREPSVRIKEINKDSGFHFEVVKTYDFSNGKDCSDAETLILQKLRSLYDNPSMKYNGSTECFVEADNHTLFSIVEAEVYK